MATELKIEINDPRIWKKDESEYVAEASTLGLPPGLWPKTINTDMGNGLPFIYLFPKDGGARHVYRQQLGTLTLSILND